MPKMKFFPLLLLALMAVMATGCKDACEKDDPCVNGTCSDVDGEAVCNCDTGWEGTNCDTPVDPCDLNDPCVNGTCSSVNGATVCTCDDGWEGTNCETEIRDKFEGTWNVDDSCFPGTNEQRTISESASLVTQVQISNILGTGLGGTATATIDGDLITIPEQTVVDNDGDSWTVSSTTGTLVNNQFTLVITFTFAAASQDCTFTFTR